MKGIRAKIGLFVVCLLLVVPTIAGAQAQKADGATQDLRSTLGELLGEHAILSAVAMQKDYDSSLDYDDALAALNDNTDDLAAAVASVYGDAAGEQFKTIWETQIGYFDDYVKATIFNNQTNRAEAASDLDNYRMEQAAFFANANPDYFDKDDIADELDIHVNHLLEAFNAYANKDYSGAYEHIREAYAHMFMMGDMLAEGISSQYPGKFPALGSDKGASDIRSTLERLLGEHAALAVLAMQKGIDGKPDFEAASTALGQNTDDLTAAVATVYGNDVGTAFEPIWSSHIGDFVDYVKATAVNDETGRDDAVADLDSYRMEQAKFFAGANPVYFSQTAIEEGLKTHVDHLLDAFNQYHDGQYESAYGTLRTAYDHMFMTGDMLASGIVSQQNDNDEAPGNSGGATGGGSVSNPPTGVDLPGHYAMTEVSLRVGSMDLEVDGTLTKMDSAPILQDGMVFIPVRFWANATNGTIAWDKAAMTVTVKNGFQESVYSLADPVKIKLNGSDVTGTYTVIDDGRLFIPVRYISEWYGWTVHYNPDTKQVNMVKQYEVQ